VVQGAVDTGSVATVVVGATGGEIAGAGAVTAGAGTVSAVGATTAGSASTGGSDRGL